MKNERDLTDDEHIARLPEGPLVHPELDAKNYYKQVSSDPYFLALIRVRHQIRLLSEQYFDSEVGAKNRAVEKGLRGYKCQFCPHWHMTKELNKLTMH